MPIQFHCEGCVSDVSFTSPNPHASLAARDELAALNYLTQSHATCQQSMLAIRESQMSASGTSIPAPAETSGSPNGAQPVATAFNPAPVADPTPAATLPVSRPQ